MRPDYKKIKKEIIYKYGSLKNYAEYRGMSVQNMSRKLSGRTRMSIDFAYELAEDIGCDKDAGKIIELFFSE